MGKKEQAADLTHRNEGIEKKNSLELEASEAYTTRVFAQHDERDHCNQCPQHRFQTAGTDAMPDGKFAAYQSEHGDEAECQLMDQGAAGVRGMSLILQARSVNHVGGGDKGRRQIRLISRIRLKPSM